MHRYLVRFLLFAFLGLMLAGPALAIEWGVGEGGPWPGKTITYYDASGWDGPVQLAAKRWNETNVGIRFVATRKRESADVLVVSETPQNIKRKCPGPGLASNKICAGYASLGFTYKQSRLVLPQPTSGEESSTTPSRLRLIVHEFGHVLGLKHIRGCSIMNENTSLPGCKLPVVAVVGSERTLMGLCGPFPEDVRRLAQLYSAPPRQVEPYCDLP